MSRSRRRDSGLSGTVIIDKPAGCTSHDVVDAVRRRLSTRKVGHAGTLDPDATGVLVLGVGAGTKLLQFVTGADKRYRCEIVLGTETSTLDSSGEVTACHDMTVTPTQVQAAADALTGDINQIPPMVSAVKVGGKRLHELARAGVEVEREPRPVTVHHFSTEPTDDPLVYRAEVECSSGTYVRTLAADLGSALGGGAHLRNLRRTAVGTITIDQAQDLDDFTLRPVIDLLADTPVLSVDAEVARRVQHGQSLGPTAGQGRLAVVGPDDRLLAVYEASNGNLVPVKVLAGR